jgi:hypothetical protein
MLHYFCYSDFSCFGGRSFFHLVPMSCCLNLFYFIFLFSGAGEIMCLLFALCPSVLHWELSLWRCFPIVLFCLFSFTGVVLIGSTHSAHLSHILCQWASVWPLWSPSILNPLLHDLAGWPVDHSHTFLSSGFLEGWTNGKPRGQEKVKQCAFNLIPSCWVTSGYSISLLLRYRSSQGIILPTALSCPSSSWGPGVVTGRLLLARWSHHPYHFPPPTPLQSVFIKCFHNLSAFYFLLWTDNTLPL